MTKKDNIQYATLKVLEAINALKLAKQALLQARSDQHVKLSLQLAGVEEIYEILTDPDCTPEILEGGKCFNEN